ncbi:MAG: potassium-transporting ATPase subunit KdpA, partial [Saprospiraceae bacterium]
MNTEILGIIVMFAATLLLALPLGSYMAKVYGNERTFLDFLFNPIERLLFKVSGIDARQEQSWQQQMAALLTINLVWFLLGMAVLMNQGWLPLNP